MTPLEMDRVRYIGGKMPLFQKYYRLALQTKFFPLKMIYRYIAAVGKKQRCLDLPSNVKIGGGAYFGHAYGITINANAVIGSNVNIHKGVTIGQENRGDRKGVPTISDEVWIGVNATIVGKVHIGKDVLIAPNAYVNCDVPDHSIVFGNPCIIKYKENATESYINRKCNVN